MKRIELSNEMRLYLDLSARLPYGVALRFPGDGGESHLMTGMDCTGKDGFLIRCSSFQNIPLMNVRPQLRDMDTMTDDEYEEYKALQREIVDINWDPIDHESDDYVFYEENLGDLLIWLNRKQFDYNYLIDKGLADALTEEEIKTLIAL